MGPTVELSAAAAVCTWHFIPHLCAPAICQVAIYCSVRFGHCQLSFPPKTGQHLKLIKSLPESGGNKCQGSGENFTAEFKTKVVLEAMKGHRTLQEIAQHYSIHPNLIVQWKKQALAYLPGAFSDRTARLQREDEELKDELYRQIGQLACSADQRRHAFWKRATTSGRTPSSRDREASGSSDASSPSSPKRASSSFGPQAGPMR
jgi:transposase